MVTKFTGSNHSIRIQGFTAPASNQLQAANVAFNKSPPEDSRAIKMAVSLCAPHKPPSFSSTKKPCDPTTPKAAQDHMYVKPFS